MKILVVEDSAFSRILIKTKLQALGHTFKIVNHGVEALEEYRANHYDVIFMDIEMPEMDGRQALKVIRTEFPVHKQHVHIIALTAHMMDDTLTNNFLAEGFDGYLNKVEMNLRQALEAIEPTINQHATTMGQTTNGKPVANKTKPYDLTYFLNFSNNDQEFVREMVMLFVASTPDTMQLLKLALSAKNWETMKQEAHKFSPRLSYLGLSKSQEAMDKIERYAGQQKNLDQLPQLLAIADAECTQVVHCLAEDFELKDYHA